jgi:hypothetical protein
VEEGSGGNHLFNEGGAIMVVPLWLEIQDMNTSSLDDNDVA